MKNKAEFDHAKRRLLTGLGGVLGAGIANQLLGGNAVSVALAYTPKAVGEPLAGSIFSAAQMRTLKVICQTVIPKTETPGAGDVDTHGFIDNQLQHCFDAAAQHSIKKTVALIARHADSRHKANFHELDSAQANAVLSDLDQAKNGFSKDQTKVFKFLKSLIVFGYYTSEVGASQELEYDAIPGGFEGSVDYKAIGSAWGSLDYF